MSPAHEMNKCHGLVPGRSSNEKQVWKALHGHPGITQVATNVGTGLSGYAVTSDSEDTASN